MFISLKDLTGVNSFSLHSGSTVPNRLFLMQDFTSIQLSETDSQISTQMLEKLTPEQARWAISKLIPVALADAPPEHLQAEASKIILMVLAEEDRLQA